MVQEKIVLKGIRDPDARLWMVPLDNIIKKHPSCPSSMPNASPSANSTAKPIPTPSSNPSSAPSNPTAAPSELPSNANAASAVLETTHTKKELVRFLHDVCFFPVISTWIKAIINGNFATFPGLTAELVSKYLPKEEPTILGHQHKLKQGIRSTTARAANIQLAPEPPVEEMHTKIIPLQHMMCTDQT